MNIKCAGCNADPIANKRDSLSDYQLHVVKTLMEFYMKISKQSKHTKHAIPTNV